MRRLFADLTARYRRGFSVRNIQRMRAFYLGLADSADTVCRIGIVGDADPPDAVWGIGIAGISSDPNSAQLSPVA